MRIFYREQSQLESGIASIVNNLRCHASVFTQREKYQGKEKQRIETSFTQIPRPSDIIVNLGFFMLWLPILTQAAHAFIHM